MWRGTPSSGYSVKAGRCGESRRSLLGSRISNHLKIHSKVHTSGQSSLARPQKCGDVAMSGILTYLDTLLSRKQIKGVCVFFQCLAGEEIS